MKESLRLLQRFGPLLFHPDDERRIPGVFNQVEAAEEREDGDRTLVLGDRSYEWFHAMLSRLVPVMTQEGKERGEAPMPFRIHVFGEGNAVQFQNALRDTGDREYLPDTLGLQD